MAKLHELLAAEKTPTAAWNTLLEETKKKFANPSHFFDGHSKSLSMLEDTPANKVLEAQAREEKPVVTTVYATLEYALDIFAKAEDLQYQKNETNRNATADVMLDGVVIFEKLPVDELLGLEARLVRIRDLFAHAPTLDASKRWVPEPNQGEDIWETQYPEENTKTEKVVIPIVMSPATVEHPAQVSAVNKDLIVGKTTMIKRSGAITAVQKAELIKRVDELVIEIKKARMRANETEVVNKEIGESLTVLLLAPLC